MKLALVRIRYGFMLLEMKKCRSPTKVVQYESRRGRRRCIDRSDVDIANAKFLSHDHHQSVGWLLAWV